MATRKRTKKYELSELVDNFGLVDLSEDEFIIDNDSDRESYFSDSEFETETITNAHLQSATANNNPSAVQSAGSTSNFSNSDATRNESMLELSSSDDDSDTAPVSNFVDHNWKAVEATYMSPSDISFSVPSGISNSVTLNNESLPVQFFLLFVTEHIIKIMVTETNRYAEQVIAHSVEICAFTIRRVSVYEENFPAVNVLTFYQLFFGLVMKPKIAGLKRWLDYILNILSDMIHVNTKYTCFLKCNVVIPNHKNTNNTK